MKLLAILITCTLVDNFVRSAPARSALIETLDGLKAKYLLMTVGPNYTLTRKAKWIIVYKNMVKKECIFREVDDSTADVITKAAEAQRKKLRHSIFPHIWTAY
uniref:Uncharacterized protein n=1 Tax=Strigamia maritima TaxID=126957 RepID=T1J9Z4_STRMM